jgi:uncharacterized membrane protein YphA (DoxX/SURF4 family)
MSEQAQPWWRRLGRTVVRFWTEPVPAEPLALFRILLAGVGLVSILCSLAPELDAYTGPGGLCPPDSVPQWCRYLGRFSLLTGPAGVPLLAELLPERWSRDWEEWGARPDVVRWCFVTWALSLFLLAVGLYTRPAAVAAWLLTVSFHTRLDWLRNGGDDLLRCGLFYLMLAPSGAVWSLDRLARRQSLAPGQAREPVRVPAWPVRLMQIQLCVVYLCTGLVKLGTDGHNPSDWVSGEATWWVLNDIAVARWPFRMAPMVLCRLLAWTTLVFELGFPLAMLIPLVRPWWLVLGVLFHAGIWATLEVGWFSAMSLCWYPLFLRGEALASWGRSPVASSVAGSQEIGENSKAK